MTGRGEGGRTVEGEHWTGRKGRVRGGQVYIGSEELAGHCLVLFKSNNDQTKGRHRSAPAIQSSGATSMILSVVAQPQRSIGGTLGDSGPDAIMSLKLFGTLRGAKVGYRCRLRVCSN